MTDKTELEVSQRARDAAAALLAGMNEGICEGRRDSLSVVQAFARFERDILTTRTDATPVATDVAALVEAAKAFAEIDLTGSVLPLDFAMNVLTIRVALAPFTKGQNDA